MKFEFGTHKKLKGHVNCPNCNHCYDITAETIVVDNKSRNEAMSILDSGKYFKYKCPKCGKVIYSQHDFLYIENSYKIKGIEYGQWAIQLVDNREEAINFAEQIDELRKQPEHLNDWTTYRVRVCWNFKDFIEKLRVIISLGDDRVIEQLRKYGKEELEKQSDKKVIDSEFLAESTKMCIRFTFDDGEDYYYEILAGDYQKGLEMIGETVIMDTDNDIIVNQEMFDTKDIKKKSYKPVHLR